MSLMKQFSIDTTLVLGGEDDPMIPIEAQEDIIAALAPRLVALRAFCTNS